MIDTNESLPIGIVDKIQLSVHKPFSEKSVTVKFNSCMENFNSGKNQMRPSSRLNPLTQVPHNAVTLKFDFEKNNVHNIEIDGTWYNVRLAEIGKESNNGEDYLFFDFMVTWN